MVLNAVVVVLHKSGLCEPSPALGSVCEVWVVFQACLRVCASVLVFIGSQ